MQGVIPLPVFGNGKNYEAQNIWSIKINLLDVAQRPISPNSPRAIHKAVDQTRFDGPTSAMIRPKITRPYKYQQNLFQIQFPILYDKKQLLFQFFSRFSNFFWRLASLDARYAKYFSIFGIFCSLLEENDSIFALNCTRFQAAAQYNELVDLNWINRREIFEIFFFLPHIIRRKFV